MDRIEGVYVATATPFNQEGELETTHYLKLLESLHKAGVDGFVPLGTTGEMATLSESEKKELIQLTLQFAKPLGKRVMVGCGGPDTKRVMESIDYAATQGADSVLVVTPYYNRPTPRGVKEHYHFLADRSPIPIILYHIPIRTALTLSADNIIDILAHPKMAGIKESSGSYALWLELSCRLDLSQKSLLAGDDDALALMLALGGSGIIAAGGNVAPAPFVKMYRQAKRGEWAAVFAEQKKLSPFVKSMFLETNPAPIKYALSKVLGWKNCLRLPLVSVTQETSERIDSVLKAMELVR